jgi:hypothetical protein
MEQEIKITAKLRQEVFEEQQKNEELNNEIRELQTKITTLEEESESHLQSLQDPQSNQNPDISPDQEQNPNQQDNNGKTVQDLLKLITDYENTF